MPGTRSGWTQRQQEQLSLLQVKKEGIHMPSPAKKVGHLGPFGKCFYAPAIKAMHVCHLGRDAAFARIIRWP
jgi:hypothetical protein